MNDRGGFQDETKPERERCGRQQAACLTLGTAALTTGVLLNIYEHQVKPLEARGIYSLLAALLTSTAIGWLMAKAERRLRRGTGVAVTEHDDALTNLANEVAALRQAVSDLGGQTQRMTYLPAPRTPQGHMYLSQSANSDGDTVPLMPRVTSQSAAVDQDALREQVEQVVAEELGTRQAVRSQGYAEGYVDGVSRREGTDDPDPVM